MTNATKLKAALLATASSMVMATDFAAHANEEIVVTATRRETSILDVPYNISAVSGDTLEVQNISDFSKLTRSIPGLGIIDVGPRNNGVSGGLIMRGLNATGPTQTDFPQPTDPAVMTYIGETPIFVNLNLRDMNRVEMLRGPQGTLYGSGSLGGTLRFIPNEPTTDGFSASFSQDVSSTDDSDGLNYDTEAVVNVPLGNTAAFRVVGGYESNAGFIDADRLEQLDADGQPTGITSTAEDIDAYDVLSIRAMLGWDPTDSTSVLFSYQYQQDDIDGRRAGSEGIDGNVSGVKVLEPFERKLNLYALEIEQDFGFATMTSATSYYENNADGQRDQSYNYAHSGFWAYYVGVPREVVTGIQTHDLEAFVQEVRFASNNEGPVNWILGGYYRNEDRFASDYDYIAGIDDFYAIVNPQERDLDYSNVRFSSFEDIAFFGELTWEMTDLWQFTGGIRYYDQEFDATQTITLPVCGSFCAQDGVDPLGTSGASGSQAYDGFLFKANTSYQVTDAAMAYLTYAEGFRHGGANGVPVDDPSTAVDEGGVFGEDPGYLFFEPDESKNYEVGVKGELFDSALSYTVAAYVIDWENPLVLVQTPNGGFPVLANGDKARSAGFELEGNAQLTDALSATAGYGYTSAKLTEDFILPEGSLAGLDGDRLPGVPEHVANLAVDYTQFVGNDMELLLHMNLSYRSGYGNDISTDPSTTTAVDYDYTESQTVMNLAARLKKDAWELKLFVDNVFNDDTPIGSDGNVRYSQKSTGGPLEPYAYDGLGDRNYYIPPRTIGVGLKYTFQ